MLPLELHAQHHDHVRIAERHADIVGERHTGRELREFHGQQRGGPAEHDLRAEFREQVDVGARHAAVRDIADDRHAKTFQLFAAANGLIAIADSARPVKAYNLDAASYAAWTKRGAPMLSIRTIGRPSHIWR